jgi:CheY-like chemotaxis protein
MGKTVLIVDDRADSRIMMKFALEKVGYPVLEAEDGEKALKMVQTQNIDLVLTDIRMPKMDGLELLKAIRKDKKNKHIKVLMITASKVGDVDQKEYFDAGADGFLHKPIQIDELREAIKKQIG